MKLEILRTNRKNTEEKYRAPIFNQESVLLRTFIKKEEIESKFRFDHALITIEHWYLSIILVDITRLIWLSKLGLSLWKSSQQHPHNENFPSASRTLPSRISPWKVFHTNEKFLMLCGDKIDHFFSMLRFLTRSIMLRGNFFKYFVTILRSPLRLILAAARNVLTSRVRA